MGTFTRRLSAFGSLTLVSLSFAAIAFASTYTTSYSFSTTVTGSTRAFTGSNISFTSPTAGSYPSKHAINKTYYVTLYRDNTWPMADSKIGKVTLTRDTSGTAQWSSVGAGNYYIYLSKANDGITLIDTNVTIANY